MPKLGESVTEGTISRWLKRPGDRVEQYEPMLEVTTDKVDTEVSAPVDGTLETILVDEGETVEVGTVIARLAPATSGNGAAPTSGAVASAATPVSTTPQRFVSPVVARLAAEQRVDLEAIQGSGAGGRVTKRDVEAFVAGRGAQPAPVATPPEQPPAEEAQLQQAFDIGTPAGEVELAPPLPTPSVSSSAASVPSSAPDLDTELVPLSPMRRAIAEHMVRSKQTAPHVTTVMEADLSRVTAHRDRNRADWERQGVKLGFTPYFVQATVAALGEVPQLNSSWGDTGIVLHRRINIGVAVALDDGLLVPVVKDSDDLSLLGLTRAVADLAERARTRRLRPDETQEGTFTVTNHGVWGSLFATPVLNQPQSGILGCGAIQKRVVVVTENGLDSFAIRPMCYLSLTFDHRVVDGATADRFLAVVKRALETYDS